MHLKWATDLKKSSALREDDCGVDQSMSRH